MKPCKDPQSVSQKSAGSKGALVSARTTHELSDVGVCSERALRQSAAASDGSDGHTLSRSVEEALVMWEPV